MYEKLFTPGKIGKVETKNHLVMSPMGTNIANLDGTPTDDMASLRSFGIPYLMPLVPFDRSGFKDTFIRAPLRSMTKRPRGMATDEIRRRNASSPSRQKEEPPKVSSSEDSG